MSRCPAPGIVDILGKLDFDFVFIDGEHGPFGLDQLRGPSAADRRTPLTVTTIARVPGHRLINHPALSRSWDHGHIGPTHRRGGGRPANSCGRAISVRLVSRSFGANRGTDYNAGIADQGAYYREANEQMLVCALLEDVAVLDNLDAILSGAGHRTCTALAQTILPKVFGYPGQPDHLEVVKTMQEITRRIRQAGRTMQLDVMQGAWISDMAARRGSSVFYRRSIPLQFDPISLAKTPGTGPSTTGSAKGPETRPEIGQNPSWTPSAMLNKSTWAGSAGYADMTDDLKDTTTTEAVRGGLGESEAAAAPDRPADGGVDYRKRRLSARCAGPKSALFMAVAAPGAPLRR